MDVYIFVSIFPFKYFRVLVENNFDVVKFGSTGKSTV